MKHFFNWLQANRSNAGHYSNSMYLDVVRGGVGGYAREWVGVRDG